MCVSVWDKCGEVELSQSHNAPVETSPRCKEINTIVSSLLSRLTTYLYDVGFNEAQEDYVNTASHADPVQETNKTLHVTTEMFNFKSKPI
ncbi:hypothetical protein BgiBS90_034444 [Biomphalaria glabrata]|nr:hypothetical protein BgiBS90_034444 [Biomphalaria glabrata]